MKPTPAETYTIHPLPQHFPTPESKAAYRARSKTLRLLSLQVSPEAFGSSYEREAAFGDEKWDHRLTWQGARSWVAVAPLAASVARDAGTDPAGVGAAAGAGRGDDGAVVMGKEEMDAPLAGDWIGRITLLGPLTSHTAERVVASEPPWENAAPAETEELQKAGLSILYFAVNGMFVLPEWRRKGVAKELLGTLLAYARSHQEGAGTEGKSVGGIRVKLFVNTDNVAATRLYQAYGFMVKEASTYDAPERGRYGIPFLALERVELYEEYAEKDVEDVLGDMEAKMKKGRSKLDAGAVGATK